MVPFAEVTTTIAELDLSEIVEKAIELFYLDEEECDQATAEYRQFLYLARCNLEDKTGASVAPTYLADKLWHAHLIYNGEYNPLCLSLYDTILIHRPNSFGLPGDATEINTEQLHSKYAKAGFVTKYEVAAEGCYGCDVG